jgi:hypothetical protein
MPEDRSLTVKSFLLLFFKKEVLLLEQRHCPRSLRLGVAGSSEPK